MQDVRVDFDKDTYRAVYVVNLGEKIYVPHVFQEKFKKESETPKQDLVRSRLNQAREDAER